MPPHTLQLVLLRTGHLHIPVFGAFAAAGLIAALLLSQRTGPLAGVAPEAMWDAGMLAAISALVISRLLLVAVNLKAFLAYPLVILTMPSLTPSGVLLTGLVVWWFLRRRGLRAAAVLDAAAPCAALLWAMVSLGSFAMGSEGMPVGVNVPWAIADSILGPIHPVEVYAALVGFALCAGLYGLLRFAHLTGQPAGKVAATGSFVGGGAVYLLDFLCQPTDVANLIWLDPAQWLGIAMLATGAFVLLRQRMAAKASPESSGDAV